MFALTALETLNLSDNDLSEPDAVVPALQPGGLVRTLLELDLRENEMRETLGSVKYFKLLEGEVFGSGPLVKLDGKVLRRRKEGGGAAA